MVGLHVAQPNLWSGVWSPLRLGRPDLDQLAWAAYESGFVCASIGTRTVDLLSSDTLSAVIRSLPALTHAIKLNTPVVGATGEPPPTIEVAVDFDNVIIWNGAAVASYDELERRMQAAARTRPQPHLSVSADKRSHYDALAHVLGIAQRSGMQQIGIRELK